MPCRYATAIVGALIGFRGRLRQAQAQRPPVGGIGSPPDAMIFYVAHGAAGACGQGCSDWIAAEGTVQWDTHKRLIAILDRQAGRKLPARSSMPGASPISMLRPASAASCATAASTPRRGRPRSKPAMEKSEAECFALKRPGGPLDAKVNAGGRRACDLACVLMLAGGVHRSLPAGTKVVLSGMSIRNRLAPNVSEERREGLTALFGEQFRSYLQRHGRRDRTARHRRPKSRKHSARSKCRHPNGCGCTSSPPHGAEPHDGQSGSTAGFRAVRDRAVRGASVPASPRRWRRRTWPRSGGAASSAEIAPALERPHRPRRHRDHLGLHHQPAAADAVLVAERLDRDDLFARGDLARITQ